MRFCDVSCCSSFHFWSSNLLLYLYFSMFFILLLFFSLLFDVVPHPSVDYYRGFYNPFYTFRPTHCRLIRDTFICSNIPFLPLALLPWVCIFYSQVFFTLHSFSNILTCVYQGFPGSRQFFLEVCRASCWALKHWPGPSVGLIHSNPQYSYSERFSFKFYHILAWITYDSSLIYLLLTRFKLFSLVQIHM